MNRYLQLRHRLAAATIVLLVFAVGLWAGWHKDAISARLSRWHNELTRTIPSPSSSPGPLTPRKSSVEAMAQTSGNGPLGWCGIRAGRSTAEARGSNSSRSADADGSGFFIA